MYQGRELIASFFAKSPLNPPLMYKAATEKIFYQCFPECATCFFFFLLPVSKGLTDNMPWLSFPVVFLL